MALEVSVPFKNHNYIAKIAEDFLKKYHPQNTYPIPIEEIAEFKLKMDIIPLVGLHKAFDVDGFLSSDCTSISVDEGIYQSRPGRYRYTLAHEIGHLVLHGDIYEKYKFDNIDGWKKFIEEFPEKEYSWFEWQAYEFAGLVLAPFNHMEKRFRYHARQIKALGIQNNDVIIDRIIELLAEDFVVSREVIQRRFAKEVDNLPAIDSDK